MSSALVMARHKFVPEFDLALCAWLLRAPSLVAKDDVGGRQWQFSWLRGPVRCLSASGDVVSH